ncbi:polysaccharide deacetylase [Prescottella defluvii]|nr:polysaccharide deacetylase [Prescottella defluvii]
MSKKIYVNFGVDVDAVAGWLGSYGGEDSPATSPAASSQVRSESPSGQALRQVRHHDVLVRSRPFDRDLPREIEQVVAAGHEIGVHGYTHENPTAMTREQETAVLDRCIDLIESFTGRKPTGYTAPWWEFSKDTNELLVERGIKYDHSLMHNDFTPYYVRVGDSWTKIDYSQPAETWMKPLERGEETDLVEIPANWLLDDLPPQMFIKSSPNSHGFVSPRHLEEMWRDQFDWVYREMDYAIFPITIHPDVSGRPQSLLMLERLIEHINKHDGVEWVTFDQMADDFKARFPREN